MNNLNDQSYLHCKIHTRNTTDTFQNLSSDAYLGSGVLANPATGGSGHVICIEILSSPGAKDWLRFSRDVGQEWMALGGVPHLAKHWDHLPGIYEHIQEVTKPVRVMVKD